MEAEILDVGGACLCDPQTVEAEEHSKGCMGVVVVADLRNDTTSYRLNGSASRCEGVGCGRRRFPRTQQSSLARSVMSRKSSAAAAAWADPQNDKPNDGSTRSDRVRPAGLRVRSLSEQPGLP